MPDPDSAPASAFASRDERVVCMVARPEWARWLAALALAWAAATAGWQALRFGAPHLAGVEGAASPAIGLLLTAMAVGMVTLLVVTLRSRDRSVTLTASGLYTDAGELLAAIGDIRHVDAGVFSFKPGNGFAVRLIAPKPRLWSPGLYWRMGRRLAVGGATPGCEGRNMARQIALMLEERCMACAET